MEIRRGLKVLVTGAASGIGRATAVAMAARGATLFLTDIDPVGLAEAGEDVQRAGGELGASRAFDVSDLEACRSFADEVHGAFGPLDVVMNIAGVAIWGQVENLEHEHWKRTIDVDLWGPIHTIECFLPEMIRAGRGGHLVNVASIAGLTGLPWNGPYATAKWGLMGLSEVLRYDLRRHRIGVTAVCPGAVDTPIQHSVQIVGSDPDRPDAKRLKERFSRHAIRPEAVAERIVTAIRKNRFLVVTPFDARLLYFVKRKCFPLYHFVMIRISDLLDRAFGGAGSTPE